MKNILAIILVFSFAITGFAQKQDFTKSGDSDAVAKEILDRISKKYEAYKSIQTEFTLEIEVPEEETEIQKGSMVTQGEKYSINLQEHAMMTDGVDFWFHSKRNQEVQLSTAEEAQGDEDLLSPQDLFSFYKDDSKYLYALVNESFEDGIAIQQIEFKPLDDESEYSKIRMTIAKKDNKIQRVKVFSKDGSRFVLKIDKFTPNKTFSNKDFQFDASKHPDVEVIDLRD